MPNNSLNYSLIMQRFIEQRAKTPEKAASFLALSVGEVEEILSTGRVSVKVNKALTRMAPNLDLSERETETAEDTIPDAERVSRSTPEVALSVAPKAMSPEELIASSYEPEVAPPKVQNAPEPVTEIVTPVEQNVQTKVQKSATPEVHKLSTESSTTAAPNDEVEAEESVAELDVPGALSDETEVQDTVPIDEEKLAREGTKHSAASERIRAAEASLDDEEKVDDPTPFRVVNNASLADELGLEELPEHVQSPASLEEEVKEVTPPVHEQDDAEMTDTIVDDTLPVRVRDNASLVDEILEDVASGHEADEVSPKDGMVEVTPAPRATPVVNKPTLQQEIVDEVAVELGVVPREELEAHRELEAITEGAPSEPDDPQVEIHDGVDMVITMSDEEASEWITDNDDGVTQHDASGLSEDTQMLELMQADRAAEEAADPEPAEPPPRVDTELDEDFKRLVDSEAMGEYITASLRRHARWSAFQQKHNGIVRSYPATGADAQVSPAHSEPADSTDRTLMRQDDMSIVRNDEDRRRIIQQGHGDPAIVSMEVAPQEEDFYGSNTMVAVEEWRNLHKQSMSMQSRWEFDNESSEYLLCRDKILAVEVYLIGECALTIKRPQAPETPPIWDEFKRNEEIAVRLNDRTSLIRRYKEAREYEQKQAAMGLLKNIAMVPVKAPVWVAKKGRGWVAEKVNTRKQSVISGARDQE